MAMAIMKKYPKNGVRRIPRPTIQTDYTSTGVFFNANCVLLLNTETLLYHAFFSNFARWVADLN